MRRKNAWTTYNKKQLDELEKLCKNYLKFLDKGKTERECVKQIVKQAEEKGYVNLADITKDKKALKAGDKVYSVCMDKTVALFQIGKKKLWCCLCVVFILIQIPVTAKFKVGFQIRGFIVH